MCIYELANKDKGGLSFRGNKAPFETQVAHKVSVSEFVMQIVFRIIVINSYERERERGGGRERMSEREGETVKMTKTFNITTRWSVLVQLFLCIALHRLGKLDNHCGDDVTF